MIVHSARMISGWWPRLVAAAQIKKLDDADKKPRRKRDVSEFLAWSFLLSHEFAKEGHFVGTAHAADDEADTAKTAPTETAAHQPDAPAPSDDVESQPSDGGKTANAAPAHEGAPQNVEAAAVEKEAVAPAAADAAIHAAVGSGTSFHGEMSAFGHMDGAWLGGGGTYGPFAPAPDLTFDPGPGPNTAPVYPVYELITLPTYSGLDPFVEKFGLGGDSTALAEEGMSAAKGTVAAALSFSQTPMTVLGFYVGTDLLDPHSAPTTADGISTQYAVQATGSTAEGAGSVNDVHGFADVLAEALNVSEGSKIQSNNLQVTDGQDWNGLLVVKGNYYEFNTIIQINLAWDRDTVMVERDGTAAPAVPSAASNAAPSPEATTVSTTPSPEDTAASATPTSYAAATDEAHPLTLIETGGNTQTNQAKIVDAGLFTDDIDVSHVIGPEPEEPSSHHQLIMGGTSQIYTVIQLNSLVGLDKIAYDVQGVLSSIGASADTGMFAQIMAGGDRQSNDSLISVSKSRPAISEDAFFRLHASDHKTVIAGNYYEFNTIVQINYVNDNSASFMKGTAQTGTGSGVFASGGSIQFNSASIIKNDHADDFFVAGRYTQYNMVLQLNALNNSDDITQSIRHPQADNPLFQIDHAGPDGFSGHSGTENWTSSAFDDASLRGHDALM
ncbi:MAG: hypothetical protein JNL45_01325 [Hyphomicrobium sp.]|nr:hypothetical protein [Hyphomicrobium sp.]